MHDQAEKLRERINQSNNQVIKTRIITVTSGKGGVGKSNFSLNFALSLMKQKKKVLIFDMDVGLANIDVLMGISPKQTLLHMVEQELSIWDIIEEGPDGLKFIAGGSGLNRLFDLDELKLSRFFQQLHSLQGHMDYIILDTGAGLSAESIRFILSADDVILVTTPEPTSITDAYAVLKMIHIKDPNVNFKLVVNRCTTKKEGEQTFNKLQMVANQFLKKEISSLGTIPDDPIVMKSVKKQTPFVIGYPSSHAAQAMERLTSFYLDTPVIAEGGVKSFLKRMFHRLG